MTEQSILEQPNYLQDAYELVEDQDIGHIAFLLQEVNRLNHALMQRDTKHSAELQAVRLEGERAGVEKCAAHYEGKAELAQFIGGMQLYDACFAIARELRSLLSTDTQPGDKTSDVALRDSSATSD